MSSTCYIESVFGTYWDVLLDCFEDIPHPLPLGFAREEMERHEFDTVAAIVRDLNHSHRLVETGAGPLAVVYYTVLEDLEVGLNLPDGYRIEWKYLIDYITDAYGRPASPEVEADAEKVFRAVVA